MTMPCLDCGALTKGSRCPHCHGRPYAERGTTTERGYGASHQRRAENRDCSATVVLLLRHRRKARQPLTADHIVPVSRGGVNGPLRVACRRCNSRRGNATIS
jgi:5-methylcytosine-specific restriction endonuclease McrA